MGRCSPAPCHATFTYHIILYSAVTSHAACPSPPSSQRRSRRSRRSRCSRRPPRTSTLLLFDVLPLPSTLSTLLTSFLLPRRSYHSPHSLDALDVPETSLLLLSSLNLFGAALHAPFNTCVASGLVRSSHHHLNVILDVLDVSLLSSSINLPSRHPITSPASQPLPTTLPSSTPPQDLVFKKILTLRYRRRCSSLPISRI